MVNWSKIIVSLLRGGWKRSPPPHIWSCNHLQVWSALIGGLSGSNYTHHHFYPSPLSAASTIHHHPLGAAQIKDAFGPLTNWSLQLEARTCFLFVIFAEGVWVALCLIDSVLAMSGYLTDLACFRVTGWSYLHKWVCDCVWVTECVIGVVSG